MRGYSAAVAWLTVVILIAHLVAPPTYRWSEHTISQLAAQGYPQSWLMQLGFIAFGVIILLTAVPMVARSPRTAWPHAFLWVYGLGILFSGIFLTSPFIPGISFSEQEASLHSVAATAAGVGISLAMIGCALREKRARRRAVHLSALVLTLLLSSAFGAVPQIAGILQRFLYLVGFLWLVLLEIPERAPMPPG